MFVSIFYLMALEYNSVQYKPEQTTRDSEGNKLRFVDFLAKTWSIWKGEEFISPIVVNKYYVARPDLISFAVYGDDKYGDMICKFNGISNPFDINEGMVLQIPPVWWATDGCQDREYYPCELLSDEESIQPKDRSKTPRNAAHSSSTTLVGDAPPFVIDRSTGLVIY